MTLPPSDDADDPESVLAVPPPDQLPIPPPIPDDAPHPGVRLWSSVGVRLAVAMFLHHFTVGAWVVTLGSYIMANSGSGGMFEAGFVGTIYGAGPLGGMLAPVITGLLADNYFATERIMAVLHLVAAGALCWAMNADSQGAFYVALIVYFACFVPSFSLVASMTFHHLSRPERDFPIVRAFSTMGWIAGGVFVGYLWPLWTGDQIEATLVPMKIGVWGELVTAGFCLLLPHTPPARRREPKPVACISGSETLDLLRSRRFVALLAIAVLAHIPSQFYYAYANVFCNWTGMTAAAAKMTLGQAVEVACMFLLPSMLLRVSVTTSVSIGMAAWALRYVMLAIAAPESAWGRDYLLYGAILLHGVAFTLVTIALQLDVDRCAGRRRRATAQGLLAVAMQGFGNFLGAEFAGAAGARWVPQELAAATAEGWQRLWAVPAAASLAVMIVAMALLSRQKT